MVVNLDGSLALFSERHADTRGSEAAIIFGDRRWTWATFHDAVLRTVAALRAEGFAVGDRIAFLGLNSDVYLILLQACYRAGFVAAPINWRLTPSEIEYLMRDSGARALIVDSEFLPKIHALSAAALPPLIQVSDAEDVSFTDWIASRDPDGSAPELDPETVGVLLYTSGTTGFPKGALLRQRNLFAGFRDMVATGESWGVWDSETVTMVATPIFHIGGTGSVTQGLIAGAAIVVMPRPDVRGMIDAIRDHRVTRFFAVPAMLAMFLDHPASASADFSSVRVLSYGASPIPLDVLRRSMRAFPNAEFIQLYGMTETAGVATWLPAADHDLNGNARMASCGKPYVGTEIAILSRAGEALPPGIVGEIAIRSGCVMLGYIGNPEATAAAIVDGLYRTGDAGFLDADGYLFIHDRVKDMIVSGGENVYPAEIERVLGDHPAVRDCAIIGVPDERWGEAVMAFIVSAGDYAEAEELREYLRTHLAGFKIPKRFAFVEELPRNASGKVLKRELRKPFWENQSRQVA